MKSFDQVGDNGGGVSIEFVCSYSGLSTHSAGDYSEMGEGVKTSPLYLQLAQVL